LIVPFKTITKIKAMNKPQFLPAIILAITVLTSCEDIWEHNIEGNGNRISQVRTLPTFNRIEVNGEFEVQVDTGALSGVTVEADENLQDFIITHVSGDKLVIEARNGDHLMPAHQIEMTVTTPAISSLELNGSGYVYSYGMNADEFSMRLAGSGQLECFGALANAVNCELEGSGNISYNGSSENMSAQIEGSGEIRLVGSAINTDYKVIGSGRIRSSQLNTNVCISYISGSGIIDAQVDHALDVTIIGSGVVNYYGNPTITSYISGSGKIIRKE
jgi:hypothetical protein